MERKKPHVVSVRLTDELYRKLETAQQLGPYRISKAEIIERGIELAIDDADDGDSRVRFPLAPRPD